MEIAVEGIDSFLKYLRVLCFGHIIVCIIGVFPGKYNYFTGAISQQLKFLRWAGN